MNAILHDGYAADYDQQVQSYGCHVADMLFGLCYEFISPGQRLLDAGIGSGLSAQLFAKAGLEVHGMDFSPAMLATCRAKGFAVDLRLHDLQQTPWPYQASGFDHVVCCGVLHFVADLETIFGQAARVLAPSGVFAFTTQLPAALIDDRQPYQQRVVGEFAIFAHAPAYVEALLVEHSFALLKRQKCFVGDDLFMLWMADKQ
ncbi:MAG TPA: class I SAM-dependent methyltransferase [Anaerolineae bacterium]|nr:class I SAM-dependent methyltransferase [Anaerolineae bacterium]